MRCIKVTYRFVSKATFSEVISVMTLNFFRQSSLGTAKLSAGRGGQEYLSWMFVE